VARRTIDPDVYVVSGATQSQLYQELVAANKRPPPLGPNDITAERFAADIGSSVEVARNILEREVKNGSMVIEFRTGDRGRKLYVYLPSPEQSDEKS